MKSDGDDDGDCYSKSKCINDNGNGELYHQEDLALAILRPAVERDKDTSGCHCDPRHGPR
ncbi:unnamed protein product [Scytosiphon promiscuus]